MLVHTMVSKTAKNTTNNENYTLELTTDAPNTERIQSVSLSLAGLRMSHATHQNQVSLDASLSTPLSIQQNLKWDGSNSNYSLRFGTTTGETLENFGIHFYKGNDQNMCGITFDPEGIHIRPKDGGVYLSNIPS